MINIVTASHNEQTLNDNLLSSALLSGYVPYIQTGYTNVPKAYNESPVRGVTMFVHNDVFLPDTFEKDLIHSLSTVPDDWGVLGVAGVRMNPGKQLVGYILDRGRVWGRPIDKAIEVDTLDELLLITRGDIKFDEQFPLDFYGADICMQVRQRGQRAYAIPAFCHHNSSREVGQRTKSFYESEEKFRNKWAEYLPIATTCTIVTECLRIV